LKARKHGCEKKKGCAWRRRRQENRKVKSQARSVPRQVTARMKGQDELTERQEDERTGVNVMVMRQVTARMKGQDELTERQRMKRQESLCGDEAGD
jgi:hypothetical protein